MASDPTRRFVAEWGESAAMMRSAGASEAEVVDYLGPPPEDEFRWTAEQLAALERIAAAIDAAGGGDGGGDPVGG